MSSLSPRVVKCMLNQVHLHACSSRWSSSIARSFLLVLLFASLGAAQSKEPKRVLILMQEDLSWPIFRLIDENVRATLRHGSPEGILIFSEHMDRTHFPDPQVQAQRAAGIQQKYANSKLDLVIEAGDFPTDMFPSVRLVHISLGPPRKLPSRSSSQTDTAGIWIELGAGKTLEAARRFQPHARQVVVIAGTSLSESILLDRVREQIAGYSNQLQIIYLTNLGFSEICKRVAALGPESIVLFVGLTRDGDGRPFISAEAISKTAALSGAPVYALFDTHVGSGAVGGYVARYDEIGKQAGEMGLQLLAGGHPNDATAQSDYLFDWRQLQRWKFSESALPAGSIVINRQPALWETYKWYITGALLLLLLETLLLLGLLWQRAKKKRFESSLVGKMAFEKILSDLSATFINLPVEQVGETIEKNLRRIAEFLKLDRITLFEYSHASAELMVTSSWRNLEVPPVPAVLQADKLPWWTKPLLRGETVLIQDLADLPEEASGEREHLRKLGAISVAIVPLKAGEQFFGAISFASVKRRVVWTGELVEQLKLLAEIFSNALVRKWAHEARFKHTAIVESSDDAIISKNLDGIILSWNAAAQRLFEFAEEEAVGQPITILIPEELRDEEKGILQRISAGDRLEHFETVRVTKSGKKLNVSLTVSPIRNSEGVIVGASKIARDITERKRAEQNLRESEDRFRLVANTAPVLIWMSGTDKLCTFFNQGWLKFTGRTAEQELGSGWASGVHPDDLERCLGVYAAAFDARVDFEMEYRLRRFDGEYRWIVDFGTPRFEPDGTFCGYIGSCVDITDRKTSEESLHTLTGRLISAQEEERARIARELHDDFSQRLALLGIGLGQLWKKLSPERTEERASVMEMLGETKDMSADIHSLSHQLHSSKLEHVGIVPALNGLCREISQKYKVEVQFSGSECPANIPKDVALCLFRVAQEALANVVKHSKSRDAQVELGQNASGVTLRVSDRGRGFESGLQNPSAGIGMIGMSERLRLVGGRLSVKSELMRGTEVLAEVPLAVPENEAQVKTQAAGR